MSRRPPRSTRTDTLFPYTTLFRSEVSMNGGEVAVVLAEGKVRVEEVEKAGNGTDMTPGRQLVITDRRWTMSNVDVKKETGWTEGRLIFMHDPLSKAKIGRAHV